MAFRSHGRESAWIGTRSRDPVLGWIITPLHVDGCRGAAGLVRFLEKLSAPSSLYCCCCRLLLLLPRRPCPPSSPPLELRSGPPAPRSCRAHLWDKGGKASDICVHENSRRGGVRIQHPRGQKEGVPPPLVVLLRPPPLEVAPSLPRTVAVALCASTELGSALLGDPIPGAIASVSWPFEACASVVGGWSGRWRLPPRAVGGLEGRG